MIYREIGFDEIDKFWRLLVDFCVETSADDNALALILERLAEGKTKAFAAENGKICGVVGYIPAGSTGIPDFLYVIPDKRKGLVGGRLQHMAERHAKSSGITKMVPMVTDDRIALYTKIGYKRSKYTLLEKEI